MPNDWLPNERLVGETLTEGAFASATEGEHRVMAQTNMMTAGNENLPRLPPPMLLIKLPKWNPRFI